MTKSKMIHTGECVTTIDLLRHGTTGGEDIFRGSIDMPLADEGWQQMNEAVGSFSAWSFLISSPLLRCREYASLLSGRLAVSLDIEPNFKEIHFGRWEGQTPQNVWEKTPEELCNFWRDAERYPPPEGERLSVFQARVITGFNTTVERYRGQHCLIVCHGGVIRQIVAHVLSMPLQASLRIQVPYACMTRLHIYHHESEPNVMSLDFHHGKFS